jgi:HAD superfamily hydrolase (TIGR01509 family)
MLPRTITPFEMNPRLIPRQDATRIHDKSVRNSALAPAGVFRLRPRIQLQPVGAVLVRRGSLSPADAAGWRRLSVPGLPASKSKARNRRGLDVTGTWNVGAVLLDMDGTLLDTEKVYFESLVAALNSCGYTDDAVPLCHAMVGLPGPDCERMLLDRYGDGFPLAAVNTAFFAKRDAMLEAGLPLKRGAVELLDTLRAIECPFAIVTSSSRHTADAHLTLAGIRGRFQTVLTRDDVTRGKPSPDLYLLAAARLGVRPEICVAVEDSNHGVTAAHAAGAITIMVPDMVAPTEQSRTRCAAVLSDLHEVVEMLHHRGGLERRPRR